MHCACTERALSVRDPAPCRAQRASAHVAQASECSGWQKSCTTLRAPTEQPPPPHLVLSARWAHHVPGSNSENPAPPEASIWHCGRTPYRGNITHGGRGGIGPWPNRCRISAIDRLSTFPVGRSGGSDERRFHRAECRAPCTCGSMALTH